MRAAARAWWVMRTYVATIQNTLGVHRFDEGLSFAVEFLAENKDHARRRVRRNFLGFVVTDLRWKRPSINGLRVSEIFVDEHAGGRATGPLASRSSL